MLLSGAPASASETLPYAGKTVTIVVGSKAGTLYDGYARLMADHLPTHIPGHPRVIVQNMPGASSLIAANYVYGVRKPDGLTLAAFYHALYFDQLVKRDEVRFDWAEWRWIGSPAKERHVLYVRADTPYRSLDDVRGAAVPPKCGVTGTTSSGYYLTKLLGETLEARFALVSGYLAGSDIDLAVERGEVQCRASTMVGYFARESGGPGNARTPVRVLVQTGRQRDPRLPDVPTIYELMDRHRTADGPRRLTVAMLAAGEFGRPLAAPPGVPEDRLRILREAFDKAIDDPLLRADARRRQLEIDPTPAAELAALAREVMGAPPEIVGRIRQLLGP
jgi:tripartite-type tricarboxylate transporter receptor subunit TctC